MAMFRRIALIAMLVCLVAAAFPVAQAATAPAPAPASDGTAIGQGFGVVALLAAFVAVFLVQPLGASGFLQ